jgi:regulator of cell morphogenesis and NO signaling
MSHIARPEPTMSVNDTLRLFPAALPALNAAGIDTCCGGAEPLATAARHAGADLDTLLAEISSLASTAHMKAGR